MRLVAVRRIEEGAKLGRDVADGRPGAIPLLRAGVKMTARHCSALIAAGIHAVYIDDELGEGIAVREAVSPETRRQATIAVASALDTAREALSGGRPVPERMLHDLQNVVELIVSDIESNADVAVALGDLTASDGYTLQHSIDVAATGLLIGQRLFKNRGWITPRGNRTWEKIDRRMSRLGLGLMLHDIGKLAIPEEILHKPGKLEPEEWELMKTHPRAGLEMLTSDLISPLVKVVVRSHHERWDGGGYPDGLAGEDIHELARIASTADVFDAVTSERPYASARPSDVGVRIVREGAGRQFDPEMVDVFKRVVAPYPPGCEVQLSDGRRGVVASVPIDKIDRPVVRVGWDEGGAAVSSPYEVETAAEPDLAVCCVPSNPGVARDEDPRGVPPVTPAPPPAPRYTSSRRRLAARR